MSDIWLYLTSEDMKLNLTSEFIGILFTLVVVSMFGGWLVRRINKASFNKRWRAYRTSLAERLLAEQDQLDDEFFYLGPEMTRISDKATEELNPADLETFRHKRANCRKRVNALLNFFEQNHFALREADIAPAIDFLAALREEFENLLTDNFSSLEDFETRLAMHLQGTAPLGENIGSGEMRYRDLFETSAREARAQIEATDRIRVLSLGRSLAEQLKS